MSALKSASSPPALWSMLRVIERRIQRRDIVRALEQLNEAAQQVSAANDPDLTACLRCIIGDAEYKQGRFAEAAAVFGQVRAQYTTHQEGRLLMRGGVGEVRSLLKLSDPVTAIARATAIVQAAAVPAPHFNLPANGSPLVVHSALPAAPLVAARFAGMLRREGYLPEASALAALAPPSPTHRKARRESAETLIRAGSFSAAETLLVRMQQAAMSRQRTLPIKGWQLLMQARRHQSKPLLLPAEIAAISAIPGHRLRSRIALSAVLAARQAGDPLWQTSLLQTWRLTAAPTPPAIRLSTSRLLLAEARRAGTDFAAMRLHATAIMANPKVTVGDYVAAARATLCARLHGAGTATPLSLANAAGRKFGPAAQVRTLHSLARTARQENDPKLAAQLYRKVREEATPHAKRRGQSTHSLAVLSLQQGNYAEAAALSAELVDDSQLSPEFRLLALDRQCTALRQLGQDAELNTARERLDSLLPASLPPSTLIRLARVARLSSDLGADGLYIPLLERAVNATLLAVQQAIHASPALTVLLELNRKLFWDFGEFERVHTLWKNLGPDRREWLWTERTAFWEYLSLVIRACGKLNRRADLESLYAMATTDAPPEALPFPATAMGDFHRENGRWTEAMAAYNQAATAQPTHLECARAYYWLALRARRQGNFSQARRQLDALRRCFGSGVALLWHWEYDARARLLLADGNIQSVADQSQYDVPFLTTQSSAVLADESTLPAF
jgi:tetratricopeptide (TPR) repeat protein